MSGRKIDTTALLSWAGVGLLILALAPAAEPMREFAKGLLGSSTEAHPSSFEASELRAELAKPALFRELDSGELEELFQGMVFHLHGRDSEALPILGKFALLGDGRAQGAIGGMYYFGKGLPIDQQEGIRWLRLAAQQGGLPERQTLAAALYGTWEWDQSDVVPEMAHAPSLSQAPQTAPALPAQTLPRFGPGFEGSMAIGVDGRVSASASMAARRSVDEAYGSGPASRRYPGALGSSTQFEPASPIILNRAGPGTYSDSNGDIYTQAGPHGVVNTRTGEFSPTN